MCEYAWVELDSAYYISCQNLLSSLFLVLSDCFGSHAVFMALSWSKTWCPGHSRCGLLCGWMRNALCMWSSADPQMTSSFTQWHRRWCSSACNMGMSRCRLCMWYEMLYLTAAVLHIHDCFDCCSRWSKDWIETAWRQENQKGAWWWTPWPALSCAHACPPESLIAEILLHQEATGSDFHCSAFTHVPFPEASYVLPYYHSWFGYSIILPR